MYVYLQGIRASNDIIRDVQWLKYSVVTHKWEIMKQKSLLREFLRRAPK